MNFFKKDGRKTYVAYHFGESDLEVRFSDGFKMMASPRRLTVKSSKNERTNE